MNRSITPPDRGEALVDSGLTYDGSVPVRVHVTRRDGRYRFSDDGGAVAAAGVDAARFAFPDRLAVGAYSVNVSRQGVVWLPGFARATERWLEMLPGLVAEGSLALYERLLDTDG